MSTKLKFVVKLTTEAKDPQAVMKRMLPLLTQKISLGMMDGTLADPETQTQARYSLVVDK